MSQYLPYLLYALALVAAVLFFGRAWVRRLFESEGEPSIRKVAFLAVVVGVLRTADLHAGPVVDALLVFAGTLVGLGTAKIIASRFSPKPLVDATDKPKPTDEETAPS